MQVDTLGYTITIDTAQIQDAMKKFEQAFKETENYMRSTFGPDFEKVWNGITAKITDTGKTIKSNVSINTALQSDLPLAQAMLTSFFEKIKEEAHKAGVEFKSVTATLRDIEYQKVFKEMSGRASTLQKDFANLNNTINKIGESFSTKGFTNFLNIDEFDAKVNTFQTKLNELKSVFADLTPEKAIKLFTEENFTEVSNKVKELKASYLELRNEEEIHQKVLKEQTRLEAEHQKQMEKIKQSINSHNQALSEQIKNQERELDIIKNRQAGAEWEKRQKEEAAIRKQAEAQAELTKQQQQELDILKWKQKYGSQATIPYNYDTIAKTDVAGKFKEISSSANEAYFNVNSLIYAVTRLSYFLGITLSFQKVISEIEEFNTKMNSTFTEIWSLMDVTEQKMETFQQSFLNTFKDAAVTFEDIFEGARLAASSGIDFEELLPFSQIAEKVAVAGKTEMKTVIDTFTSYIDAYQGKVEDLNKVSNAMFQGVKYGKETFEQLNTSLGKLIPVAAQAGVSMEEVIAGISTLTRVGVSPKQSATQLARIIQDIIQPSEDAQKMASLLGLQFDSLSLKSQGLYGFLNELKIALERNKTVLEDMGMTPVEALGKLFNRAEALRGALALTGTAAELFGNILTGVSSDVDVISDAYDKNSQSLESIDARIENTVNHMKGNFEPVVKSVKLAVEGLAKVFDAFVSTADPTTLAISGVGVAISLLVPIIGNVIDMLKKLGTTMNLTFKFTGIGLAISAITAIGSLIAGSIIKSQEKVIENNEKIEKTTEEIADELKKDIDNITMKISDVNTQITKTIETAKDISESFKTLEQEVIDYNYAFKNGLTTVETHKKAIDTLIEKFPTLKTAIEKSAEGYLVFNDNIKNVIELQLTMLENQKKIAENSLKMAEFELAQMEANPNMPKIKEDYEQKKAAYTKLQNTELPNDTFMKELTPEQRNTVLSIATSDVDTAYNSIIKILTEKKVALPSTEAGKLPGLVPKNSEEELKILLSMWSEIFNDYNESNKTILQADNAILQAKNTIASRKLEIEKTTALISEMKKIPETLKTTTTSGIPSTPTAKTEKLSTYEMNESDLNKQVEDYVKEFEEFKKQQQEWSKETFKGVVSEQYKVLSGLLTSVLQEEKKIIQERVIGNIKVGLTPKDADWDRLAKLTSYEQTYLFQGTTGINTKEQDTIAENLNEIESYKKYLDTITGDSIEKLEERKSILSKIASSYENIKQAYIKQEKADDANKTQTEILSYSKQIEGVSGTIQDVLKQIDKEELKKQIMNFPKETVLQLEAYKMLLEDLKGLYDIKTDELQISDLNTQIQQAEKEIQRLTKEQNIKGLTEAITKFSSDPLMQEEVLKLYTQRSELLWELAVDYLNSGMKEEYEKVVTEFEENNKAKTELEQQRIRQEIKTAEDELKTMLDTFDPEKTDALFTIEKIKETFKDISGLYKKISDEAKAFDYEQSLKAWENSYNDYLKKIEIEKMITLSDESLKNIKNYVEGTADWILAVKAYLESLKNLDKLAGTDSSATIKQWEIKMLEASLPELQSEYEQNYTNESKKPYILKEYRQSLETLKGYYYKKDEFEFNKYTKALDELDSLEKEYEATKQRAEEQEKIEAEIGRIDLMASTLDEIEDLNEKLSKAKEISKSYEKLGATEKKAETEKIIKKIETQIAQQNFEEAKATFEKNREIMDTVLLRIYADNYIKAYEAIAVVPEAQANVKKLSKKLQDEIKSKENLIDIQEIFNNLNETLIKLSLENALEYLQKTSETYSGTLTDDQKSKLDKLTIEYKTKINEQTKTKDLTKIEKMQTEIASMAVESAFDATIKLDKINEMLKEINSFANNYGLTESMFNLLNETEKQKIDIENGLNLEKYKTEIEQVLLSESKLTETYNTIQQKFEEAKTLNAEGRTWEELSTDADMLIEKIQNELELIPEVTGYTKEIIEIVKKSLQEKLTGLKGISLASDLRSKLSDIQVEDFEFNFNDFFDTLIQNNFNFSSYLEKLQQQIEKLNKQKEKLNKIIEESSEGSEEKQDAEIEKEKIENTVKEIDKTKTKLENAQKDFENDFVDFLVNISGLGSEASGIIKGIIETVQLSMTNAPEAIFSAFGVALKILTTIINTAQESAKNAKKIKDELAEKDFLSGKTSRTAEFEKFKKDREKEIEETLAKIKNIMFNDIFGFLKNDEFKALVEKLKKLQEDTAEDTQNKFADIYGLDIDSIASIVESAFDSVDISQFNENIEMSLKQAVKKAIIQAMIDSLISSTAMKRVIEIIQQLVKTPSDPELLKRLKEETSKASELLASTFTPIFEMLKNTFPEVFGQVNTAVEAVGAVLSEETGNKIVGVFSTLSSSQQRFNTLFEKYIDKASQMLETIELTLTELKAENKENTEEIKNKIQEIIDKIETDFTLNIDLKPVTDNLNEIKKSTEAINENFIAFKNDNWQTVDLILANINTIKGYIFDIREKVINGIIKVEMQNSTKFLDVNRAVGG